jgi:hypothetical protein
VTTATDDRLTRVTRDQGVVNLWATWVAGLLSGDRQCEWAAWYRAHNRDYERTPSDFDAVSWRAAHAAMVRARAQRLREEGYTVYMERQNGFQLRGRAAILGGTPDIVAVRADDALVVDCKTGRQRDSDAMQVLLYLLVLPFVHPACSERKLRGEVQYRESRVSIDPEDVNNELRAEVRELVTRLAADQPPEQVPSWGECRFCDIAGCEARVELRVATTHSEHDLF